jgi:hypothetical protein
MQVVAIATQTFGMSPEAAVALRLAHQKQRA